MARDRRRRLWLSCPARTNDRSPPLDRLIVTVGKRGSLVLPCLAAFADNDCRSSADGVACRRSPWRIAQAAVSGVVDDRAAEIFSLCCGNLASIVAGVDVAPSFTQNSARAARIPVLEEGSEVRVGLLGSQKSVANGCPNCLDHFARQAIPIGGSEYIRPAHGVDRMTSGGAWADALAAGAGARQSAGSDGLRAVGRPILGPPSAARCLR